MAEPCTYFGSVGGWYLPQKGLAAQTVLRLVIDCCFSTSKQDINGIHMNNSSRTGGHPHSRRNGPVDDQSGFPIGCSLGCRGPGVWTGLHGVKAPCASHEVDAAKPIIEIWAKTR
jgi:hypothetical protein